MKLALAVIPAAFIIVFVLVFGSWAFGAQQMCGVASFYGYEAGRITASGERFNPHGLTAAMPSRKHLGERYRVHYGHKSVDVRITDVGPALRLHRIIDLSLGAAQRIGLVARGVGTVCLERLP